LSLFLYAVPYSVTMMSTVEYLWSQKSNTDQKIGTAEEVIETLNRHIQELGVQNVKLRIKTKISKGESARLNFRFSK
jgi:hypothetical protein